MTEGFHGCLGTAAEASQSSIGAFFLSRVVPLIAAQRNVQARNSPSISGEEFARFCELCRLSHEAALWRLCKTWLTRGLSAESIIDTVIRAAAEGFGQAWLDDRCHFAEVTQVCWQLQLLLQRLTPQLEHAQENTSQPASLRTQACPVSERRFTDSAIKPRAIMLSAAQGSHRLGLMVAASLLRREGLEVHCGHFSSQRPFLSVPHVLDDPHWRLLGLSLGCSQELKACRALVRLIRRQRPDVCIVLGGCLIDSSATPGSLDIAVDAVICGKPVWYDLLERFKIV
jgi:methylmalonyl-CoA mutase cobalamin-binding subunit